MKKRIAIGSILALLLILVCFGLSRNKSVNDQNNKHIDEIKTNQSDKYVNKSDKKVDQAGKERQEPTHFSLPKEGHFKTKIKNIRTNQLTNNFNSDSSLLPNEENNISNDIRPHVNAYPTHFILENKVIIGLTKEGLEDIKKTKKIKIPEGIVGIKDGVFKNLALEQVELANTLVEIGKDCFFGNKIKKIDLPTSLQKIGRGAFDYNQLEQLVIPNPLCKIDGVFYNDQYVNIITANKDVHDEAYFQTTIPFKRLELEQKGIKPFGSVINRAGVKVTYYDDQDKVEFVDHLVSKERKNHYRRSSDHLDKYFKIGEKINVVARRNDYLHLANVFVEGAVNSEVAFHYNNEEPALTSPTDYRKPIFNGLKQAIIVYVGSPEAHNIDFKKDLFACDYKMNNITDKIKVYDSEKVDVNKPGIYTVRYEVQDEDGNQQIGKRHIYVEKEHEWYPYDFYFENDIVLGLSKVGEYKLNERLVAPNDKQIILPSRNDQGKVVTKIGSAAFARLRTRKIVIPNTYQEIRAYAFESNLLAELILPDSIVKVGDKAFAFNNIQNLYLSKNLQIIGKEAFSALHLKEINLPASLIELGEGAFKNNAKLVKRELEIPVKIKTIPVSAFANCHLTKLVLHEGLETIEDNAFGKNNLVAVKYLPSTLKNLSASAFKQNSDPHGSERYSAVKLYTKDGKNPNHFISNVFQVINPVDTHINKEEYIESDFKLLAGNKVQFSEAGKQKAKTNKNLVIPDTIAGQMVEGIAQTAFMYKHFQTIKLPHNLKFIENTAFAGNDLTNLTLPNTLIRIDGSAFYGNTKLTSLKLSDKLEEIGKNAFMNTALTSVNLPNTIKRIEKDAFKLKTNTKKVKLTIKYNDQTKKFISDNQDRSDFDLDVQGMPLRPLTKKKIVLTNKATVYGIKAGQRLKFSLTAFQHKVRLKVNNHDVNVTKVGNDIYVSSYVQYLNNEREQIFTFEEDGIKYEKRIVFFKPEKIVIKNNDQVFSYTDNLELELVKDKYAYKNLHVYRNQYSGRSEKNVILQDNKIKLPKTLVDDIKKDNVLKLYIEDDYHAKTLIVIKLKHGEDKAQVNFSLIGNKNDVYTYQTDQVNDDIYQALKDDYTSNNLGVAIGRTTYDKDEYAEIDEVSEDKYLMLFDDQTKSIKLCINKPKQFEELHIKCQKYTFIYDIEDDYKLTVKD